jgi:hypothetical protein
MLLLANNKRIGRVGVGALLDYIHKYSLLLSFLSPPGPAILILRAIKIEYVKPSHVGIRNRNKNRCVTVQRRCPPVEVSSAALGNTL